MTSSESEFTRKQRRERAREERRVAEAAAAAAVQRRTRMIQLGGVLGAVAVIVVVLIVVSSSGKGTPQANANHTKLTAAQTKAAAKAIPASVKTAVTQQHADLSVNGAAQTATLLAGIPQSGLTLGSPSAPVTVVFFGDLNCSACDAFDLTLWPSLVPKYVRTGKIQVVWRGLHIIDSHFPGQTDALRADEYGDAASEQNKLWNFANLFYHNQGQEGSNYVTPTFLATIGRGVGLNNALATKDATSSYVTSQVQTADSLSNSEQISSTPTFLIGKTGGKQFQEIVGVPSLAQFESVLTKLGV
jgi:protein-disulfide isomerase